MKRRAEYIFIIFLFIVSICLIRSPIFANNNYRQSTLRNPFLTLQEQKLGVARDKKKPFQRALNLQGVFIKPDRKFALINGQVVKEGGFIEGKEISSIQKEQVILKDKQGNTLVLGLPLVLSEPTEIKNRR